MPPDSVCVMSLRDGAFDAIPVSLAVAPFGLVLGALAVQAGLSPAEVGLMSALVFAGSAQFVAVDLWQTPAPVGVLALTALLVNLRHVLMGAALSPKLGAFPPRLTAPAVFLMADEIWALGMRRAIDRTLTPSYWFGLGLLFYANWFLWTLAGALVGAVIDDPLRWGFDFAFVAVFLVLLAGMWRGRTSVVVWSASAFAAVGAHQLLPPPWYVLIGALAGMAVAAISVDRTAP